MPLKQLINRGYAFFRQKLCKLDFFRGNKTEHRLLKSHFDTIGYIKINKIADKNCKCVCKTDLM